MKTADRTAKDIALLRAPTLFSAAMLALASITPSARAQAVDRVPVAYGAGTARDALPVNARTLPTLPLPSGAKVMAFCDSHSAFNNVAANAGILAAPATAKGLVEAT